MSTYRSWRWIAAGAQALVMLCLPFFTVNGESALRFDIPSLKLYFFGSVVWISEAFFFLLVFLLFFAGIMLFTVLYGRIWCGWVCPQTVLSDLTRSFRDLAGRLSGHPVVSAVISHLFLVAFSVVVSASLIWYFVSPYAMFEDIRTSSLGPWTTGTWAFFSVLLYLDLAFVRQRFCGAVCPYARMQSAFFDHRTLTISFDQDRSDECLGCEACTHACPAGIDIRKGLQVECINCAECVDACAAETAGVGRPQLVDYAFGEGARTGRGLRPRVIGLAALFAFLAVLFAWQMHQRMPVDFWVLRDERQPFHQHGIRDQMMNTFYIIVENRSLAPAEYALTVSGIEGMEAVISRNPFVIPSNSILKMRIYLFADISRLKNRNTQVRFTLENTRAPEVRIVREASFLYSDRSDKGVDI